MKNDAPTCLLALLLWLFLQQITLLVEAIYALNLLQLSLNASALGIAFLFAPIFLLFFRRDMSLLPMGIAFLIAGAVAPWTEATGRILFSGLAVATFLLFLGCLFANPIALRVNWSLSLAVAVLFTAFFKIAGASLDITTTGWTRFIGLALCGLALALFILIRKNRTTPAGESHPSTPTKQSHLFAAVFGFVSCLILLYFAFATPVVLARWAETSYTLTHVVYVAAIALVIFVAIFRSYVLARIGRNYLLALTGLFLFSLIFTILKNSIDFPASPQSPAVIVSEPALPATVSFFLMLLFAPVLLIHANIFAHNMRVEKPSQLALPLLVACLFFSLLIFMLIFTNVWGYVGDFSRIFRNKFYLPFALAGIGVLVLLFIVKQPFQTDLDIFHKKSLAALAGGLVLLILFMAVQSEAIPASTISQTNELTVLTYNIQQGVNGEGRKSYQQQLAVIRRIDPDVICLQESDVARISGGNSDVARFFAQKLNYHAYYGPKTVTGTFGAAILCRYPLANCRSIFTFSDTDEIGTAVADLAWRDKIFAIYNNHPAGSADVHVAHVDELLRQIKKYDLVIAAGDFNFTPDSPHYQKMANVLQNAWQARPAVEILNESNETIDHIFLSKNFYVKQAEYLPPPASQSDHPAHWATMAFSN